MSCSLDQNLLQDYVENTIEPLEKIILLEHLKICKVCRRELTELKLLQWEINNLPSVDLPKEALSVKESVLNKIREEKVIGHKRYKFKNFIDVQNNAVESASIFLRFIPGTNKALNIINSMSNSVTRKRKSIFTRSYL